MAITITHNSTADGDPLIDGDDWNANHTITGGGTLRVPQLIESKTLDDTTSATFSSLDGDSAGAYFLKYDLTFNTTTERCVYLLPGGATQGDFIGNEWINLTNVDKNSTGFLITSGSWSKGHTWGQLEIYSKSGQYRSAIGYRLNSQSTSNLGWGVSKSQWNDTSTNITSLVLNVESGNSLDGWIKLYKMVDLAL